MQRSTMNSEKGVEFQGAAMASTNNFYREHLKDFQSFGG